MYDINIPADRGRSNFLRAAGAVAAMMGLSTVDQLLQQYKVYNTNLKLPQQLTPGVTSYSFNPVTAVQTPVPGEVKIQKNDWFCVTGVGLRFTRAEYVSSNGTLNNYGNYPEYTWPYSSVFAGPAGAGGYSEAECLEAIVRGNLQLSVNNDEQWKLPVSELVYRNQQVNGQESTIVYGPGSEGRGICNLDSIIILNGGVDNLVTLNLLSPSVTDVIDGSSNVANDVRNLVMPVLEGILIKNVANGGGGYTPANCRV